MTEAVSKIRIKMGPIEVECEGSEQFLKKELPDILTAVSNLYKESGEARAQMPRVPKADDAPSTGSVVGTTATLAGKLKVKSGNDLVIAGAAHLTLVKGKSEFSRQELLDEVKGASGYYKESYNKNLTNYLNSRVKAGHLLEPRTGYYSLGADKKAELEKALAA